MSRQSVVLSLFVLAAGLSTAAALSTAQDIQARTEPAKIRVLVPPDASLLFDGTRTKQVGEFRRFESPPLAPGRHYQYTLKASWTERGKVVEKERIAHVAAGEETTIDFRAEPARDDKTTDSEKKQTGPDREPDVIFVPTPYSVVEKMLELADVKKGDVVYDLGCGDGRIPVTAAKKFGVKAFGYDIDPARIRDSLANVKRNKVDDLVTIKKQDIFQLDLTPASVVTLYLLPELNVKLMPQLEKLKPGTRIVSHDFDMRGAKPKQHLKYKGKGDDVVDPVTKQVIHTPDREHDLYLWVVPWEKE